MSVVIMLDSPVVGMVTNPKPKGVGLACVQWMKSLLAAGRRIILPEMSDYEVRRELLRANKLRSVHQLNSLARIAEYLPITTAAMREAAAVWAKVRQKGMPTAGNESLDGDAVLAGQALSLGVADFIVATTNVAHLSRFVPAELWQKIPV